MFFLAVITTVLRLQWEPTFGLEEKADRIARHPTLRSFEGQDVMKLPWKCLYGTELEMTEKRRLPVALLAFSR